jgi:uncharacterized protein (TIRG00374 family)|tara:strand:- start:6140 stop:7048 length:909 start_codon:yes stop_codon:yes gene_type:complete
MKKIWSWIIFILIAVIAFFFIRENIHEFSQVPEFSFVYIIPLVILVLLNLFANGLRIKLYSEYYNINLKPIEWFGLVSISIMGNHLTPFRAGHGARAIYLKKKYKLPYTSFLTTMASSYVIKFLVYGGLGIILSLLILKYYNIFNKFIFLLLVVLFIISLVAIFTPPIFKKNKNKFLNRFIRLLNEWKVMSKNHNFLYKIISIDVIVWILRSFRLFFAFKAFSFDVPFLFILLIAVLSVLSVFLSLTPAGIGVLETVVALSAEAIGIGFVGGVYAGVLDRVVSVIIIFIFGPIFSYKLMRNL